MNTEVCVDSDVITCDTVFGVNVAISTFETIIVSIWVIGEGVRVVYPVAFEVVSLVVVESAPLRVRVVEMTSFSVEVVNFGAGVTTESWVEVAVTSLVK